MFNFYLPESLLLVVSVRFLQGEDKLPKTAYVGALLETLRGVCENDYQRMATLLQVGHQTERGPWPGIYCICIIWLPLFYLILISTAPSGRRLRGCGEGLRRPRGSRGQEGQEGSRVSTWAATASQPAHRRAGPGWGEPTSQVKPPAEGPYMCVVDILTPLERLCPRPCWGSLIFLGLF